MEKRSPGTAFLHQSLPSSGLSDFRIECEREFGAAALRKELSRTPCLLRESLPECRIFTHALEMLRENGRGRIARKKKAILFVLYDFACSGSIQCDHWKAGRHGLGEHHPLSLAHGGKCKNIHRGVRM